LLILTLKSKGGRPACFPGITTFSFFTEPRYWQRVILNNRSRRQSPHYTNQNSKGPGKKGSQHKRTPAILFYPPSQDGLNLEIEGWQPWLLSRHHDILLAPHKIHLQPRTGSSLAGCKSE